MNSGAAKPQILIVGVGIQIPEDITVRAAGALEAAEQIFSILPRQAVRRLPGRWRAKTVDLRTIYMQGRRRRDVYGKEIELIQSAARRAAPVAYLTVGNPVVFDSVSAGLINQAEFRTQVVPGISSVDAVMATLRLDYAPGLQVLDASSILACNILPRADLACLLMQPDVFGTSYVAMGRSPSWDALRPLQEQLLRVYPGVHRAYYVTCAVDEGSEPQIEEFALAQLCGTEDCPRVPGASLFLPPASALELNATFLDQMNDRASFEANYPGPV